MDQRSHQTGEAIHLLGLTTTSQSQDTLRSHTNYASFEKDVEAGHVADESSKVTMLYAPPPSSLSSWTKVPSLTSPSDLTNSECLQQLTLVEAFKAAWDMSNSSGRLGLVIHALLIAAAVVGLVGLALYIPVLAVMEMMGWAVVDR